MAAQAVVRGRQIAAALQTFKGWKLLTADCAGSNGIAGFDSTKVTVNVAAWGYTGIEAGKNCGRQVLP